MIEITDEMVDAVLDPAGVQAVVADAFRDFATGEAAVQERLRTAATTAGRP